MEHWPSSSLHARLDTRSPPDLFLWQVLSLSNKLVVAFNPFFSPSLPHRNGSSMRAGNYFILFTMVSELTAAPWTLLGFQQSRCSIKAFWMIERMSIFALILVKPYQFCDEPQPKGGARKALLTDLLCDLSLVKIQCKGQEHMWPEAGVCVLEGRFLGLFVHLIHFIWIIHAENKKKGLRLQTDLNLPQPPQLTNRFKWDKVW